LRRNSNKENEEEINNQKQQGSEKGAENEYEQRQGAHEQKIGMRMNGTTNGKTDVGGYHKAEI
jgi:hypothetical protein